MNKKCTIIRKSVFTGNKTSMELNCTQLEFECGFLAWETGTLIQNAFPMLNADEREFVKTGCTPAEWDNMFS